MLFSSLMQAQSQKDVRIAHSILLLRHYIDLIVYTEHLCLDSLFINGNRNFKNIFLNLRKLLQGYFLKALDKTNHQKN